MRGIFAGILLAAFAGTAAAQEFEVVSIKPNRTASNGSSTHSNQGRLTGTNVSLRTLIVMAYGLRDYQVEGPDWLTTERYDVSAKFPEALPKEREPAAEVLRTMMQKMLKDRFQLVSHKDQKTFSVYALLVGKGGIKFKEVPDGESHNSQSNNNHYTGTCVSMAGFASFLSGRMDLPVLDMTGLKGYYDMKLDWVPEPSQTGGKDGVVSESPTGPTLTVALQEQLGLKVEGRKAPIEILIVDRAERAPTEN